MRLTFTAILICALQQTLAPQQVLGAVRMSEGNDTTLKALRPNSLRINDSSRFETWDLIQNHPIFNEYWDNTETFPYEKIRLNNLPERIEIPLLRQGERFTLTWYGRLNSPYGIRKGQQHHGLDLQLHTGDRVFAAFDGIVRYAKYNRSGFGNCIVIRHFNGLETVYAHLSKIEVPVNSLVCSGEPIGRGGNTGRSYGSHLHFEIRFKDFSIDPELLIDVESGQLRMDTLLLSRHMLGGPRYPGDLQDRPEPADSILRTAESDLSALVVLLETEEDPKPVVIAAKPKSVTKGKAHKPVYYTIRKGDNLGIIQRRTGIPQSRIRSLNPGLNTRKLRPGKKLRIR
jgi:murein DD-endopeptidase MepM/ murein hydrolase activator NlpD